MEAVQIKKALKTFEFHARIAWRGFYRTVYGAAVAGLAAMAVYGFVSVNTETGWVAVCDFIASSATMMVAIVNIYFMGCNKKGEKHG